MAVTLVQMKAVASVGNLVDYWVAKLENYLVGLSVARSVARVPKLVAQLQLGLFE
jgi:hypothetical protein